MIYKLITLVAVLGIFTFITVAKPAEAYNPLNRVCNNGKAANSEFCKDNTNGQDDTADDNVVIRTIRTAANIVALLAGLLAVIMIMIGGMTYVTSGGSSDKLTTARNRILYSVIGLIVVVLAWAIVRFIIDRVIQ